MGLSISLDPPTLDNLLFCPHEPYVPILDIRITYVSQVKTHFLGESPTIKRLIAVLCCPSIEIAFCGLECRIFLRLRSDP
jgi:hypothetical protein